MRFQLSNPFNPPPAPPAFGSGKILPEKSSPLVFNGFYFLTHSELVLICSKLLSLGFFQGLSSIGFHRFLRLDSLDPLNQRVCPSQIWIFVNRFDVRVKIECRFFFCRSLGTSSASVNVLHHKQNWGEFLFTMSTRKTAPIHEQRNSEYDIADIISFSK